MPVNLGSMILSIVKSRYGLERVLWSGQTKTRKWKKRGCAYRRENMGGMDVFDQEQINILDFDLSSLCCQRPLISIPAHVNKIHNNT